MKNIENYKLKDRVLEKWKVRILDRENKKVYKRINF
jgi:hypothetical protein